jgi:SAM-dependent methyltransferase
VTAAEQWLAAMWTVVRDRLPAPPAKVLEIGCGRLGGFIPMLRSRGYEAVGVDPEAPDGAEYRRVEFEQAEAFEDVDAVVASTSLHHVSDPELVIDRLAGTLATRGTVVVVEWDWERFDEPTALWCFARLGSDDETGWLHRRRDEWNASGKPWGAYVRAWARREHVHAAETLLRLLDQRFDREHFAQGPYFFPDLAETSEEDERAAIEARQISATRVDYVGKLRSGVRRTAL